MTKKPIRTRKKTIWFKDGKEIPGIILIHEDTYFEVWDEIGLILLILFLCSLLLISLFK